MSFPDLSTAIPTGEPRLLFTLSTREERLAAAGSCRDRCSTPLDVNHYLRKLHSQTTH